MPPHRAHYRPDPYTEGTTMGFLQGKRALMTGIASQRSIANGIAEAMPREGAELAFTSPNDKLPSRAEGVAARRGGCPSITLAVPVSAHCASHLDGPRPHSL